MKEIRFRAWKDGKLVAPANAFYVDATGMIVQNPDACDCLEQYTGIRDKNGKDIFEGDIVENSWGEGPSVVEYYVELCGYYPFSCPALGGYEWEHLEFDDDVEITILGNIHENPELVPKE